MRTAAKSPAVPRAAATRVRRVLDTLARARGPVRWRREDPVVCLIGTILAQATNDPLAERAYRALRTRYPAWGRVLAAPRAEVERTIRMCGLARQKAGAIRAFLRYLKETRGTFRLGPRGSALPPSPDWKRDANPRTSGGRQRQDIGAGLVRRSLGEGGGASRTVWEPTPWAMPLKIGHGVPTHTVDALLADLTTVPGVGIKTAAITLMFGYGADLCAVDTHLVRILRRLRVVPEKSAPDRAFRILRPLVPDGRGIELHLQLIRHGRETCKALRPRCGACPIRRLCPSVTPTNKETTDGHG
jgi:endonuclease III